MAHRLQNARDSRSIQHDFLCWNYDPTTPDMIVSITLIGRGDKERSPGELLIDMNGF